MVQKFNKKGKPLVLVFVSICQAADSMFEPQLNGKGFNGKGSMDNFEGRFKFEKPLACVFFKHDGPPKWDSDLIRNQAACHFAKAVILRNMFVGY